MRKCFIVFASFMISFCMVLNAFCSDQKVLKMSTTTSTQSSGLLDILLPEFKKDTGISVKVIAKGTGAAIRDCKDGNVDIIFVHAKSREEKFVKDGYGTKRYAVMHNDFIIIGPKKDPANIKGTSDVLSALNKIAKTSSMFVSRGDDSGTHTKEQFLWKKTDVTLKNKATTIVKKGKKLDINYVAPSGKWYYSLGQGMGKTITFADEKQAYTLSDRGTYLKFKYGRKQPIDLVIVCEGNPLMANPYGIIPVNPKKYPNVKYDLAEKFANWIVSKKAQSMIAGYKLLGKQLFYPDAVK